MARRVGFVLVFVGLSSPFFGLFERFYAYPRLKKAPPTSTGRRQWPPEPAPTSTAAPTGSRRSPAPSSLNKRVVRRRRRQDR